MKPYPFSQDEIRSITTQASQKAAAALADMLNTQVEVSLGEFQWISYQQMRSILEQDIFDGVMVQLGFSGDAEGVSYFFVPRDQLRSLLEPILAQDQSLRTTSDYETVILVEIGNVILNIGVGTILNLIVSRVEFKIPQVIYQLQQAWEPGPAGEPRREEKEEWLFVSSQLSTGDKKVRAYILVLIRSANPGKPIS